MTEEHPKRPKWLYENRGLPEGAEPECGVTPNPDPNPDAVPVPSPVGRGQDMGAVTDDEIREIITRWREFADASDWSAYNRGVHEAVRACADELEALLNDD